MHVPLYQFLQLKNLCILHVHGQVVICIVIQNLGSEIQHNIYFHLDITQTSEQFNWAGVVENQIP